MKSCPNQYWVWVAAQAQETAKLATQSQATQSQAQVSADRTASDFYCKYNVNPVGSPKVNLFREEMLCKYGDLAFFPAAALSPDLFNQKLSR